MAKLGPDNNFTADICISFYTRSLPLCCSVSFSLSLSLSLSLFFLFSLSLSLSLSLFISLLSLAKISWEWPQRLGVGVVGDCPAVGQPLSLSGAMRRCLSSALPPAGPMKRNKADLSASRWTARDAGPQNPKVGHFLTWNRTGFMLGQGCLRALLWGAIYSH